MNIEISNINISGKNSKTIVGSQIDNIIHITSTNNQATTEEMHNRLKCIEKNQIERIREICEAYFSSLSESEKTSKQRELKDFLIECGISVNQNIMAASLFELINSII